MRSRLIPALLVVLATVGTASGRITAAWTYQQMYDKADLVVIAYAVSTKDTAERTTLNDIEPHVPVIKEPVTYPPQPQPVA